MWPSLLDAFPTMDLQVIADNLLAGPILFFLFGFVAVALKADLELPQPLPKFLSTFLVIAIGLKGGIELGHGGLTVDSFKALALAVGLSVIVPLYCFLLLRSRTTTYNAAAISATYGSVSAVTFITAISTLDGLHIQFHGYMVAAMALMEAPAIIIGVILVQYFAQGGTTTKVSVKKIFHDALLHGPILLLLGTLVIGRLMSPASAVKVKPLFEGLFPGILCLYLFDMGLNAARRLTQLNLFDRYLTTFAVVVPVFNAGLAIALAKVCGLSQGDTILLAVLAASASYIAVPAAMQLAVPQADASLYLTMALGITFPFNIAVGIPTYVQVTKAVVASDEAQLATGPAPRVVESHSSTTH
jgi:hypothetical protein